MDLDVARGDRESAVPAPADRAGAALGRRWRIAAALAGIALLAAAGWLAWREGALVGLRWVEFDAPLAMAALGFLAGVGAFFAPCAFALFPGYVSYYLALSGAEGGPRRAMGLGLACAAGAALFFALVGAVVTLAGGGIGPYLVATKPFVALAVVGLGLVQVLDVRLPSLALPLGLGPGRAMPAAAAVFAYGFGYALASTGCTLPLYVSITVLPLTSGFSGAALLTFGAFAAAMALLMLATTILVGLAKQNLIRAMQRSTAWIKRGSGVVLILVGLYLGYYYVRAGM
jgi:cytochrome c biogenesis protein CcdA